MRNRTAEPADARPSREAAVGLPFARVAATDELDQEPRLLVDVHCTSGNRVRTSWNNGRPANHTCHGGIGVAQRLHAHGDKLLPAQTERIRMNTRRTNTEAEKGQAHFARSMLALERTQSSGSRFSVRALLFLRHDWEPVNTASQPNQPMRPRQATTTSRALTDVIFDVEQVSDRFPHDVEPARTRSQGVKQVKQAKVRRTDMQHRTPAHMSIMSTAGT